MAATAPLLRLPPELMLRVSHHLNTIELGNFRLACKRIETSLFESFAREFFTKRQFMIEHHSLEALHGIASHKTLAPYLTEVIISTSTLGLDISSHRPCLTMPRDVLLATGHAHTLLVRIFSKLPNLRTVGLRDYDGRGRERDGSNARWRSYGWRLAPFGDTPSDSPSALLPLILQALCHASATPENIEVFLRRRQLPDYAFMSLEAHLEGKVAPLLSGLKRLLLSLDEKQSHDLPIDLDSAFYNLKVFLSQTRRLEHLRLNFGSENASLPKHGEKLLVWLGSRGTQAHTAVPSIDWGSLTTLDLGLVTLRPQTILGLVSKFASLKSLSLWKTSLFEDATLDNVNIAHTWPPLLQALAKAFQMPLNVEFLMIGWASEILDRISIVQMVKFASTVKTDANGEKVFEGIQDVVSFRKRVGSDLRDWLEALAEGACTPASNRQRGSQSGSTDEDSIDGESGIESGLDDDSEDDDNDGDEIGDAGSG